MATPRKKTESEMALQDAIKVERSSTRLKYSLMADHDLNDSIAAIVEDFVALESAGKGIRITTDFGGRGVIISEDVPDERQAIA